MPMARLARPAASLKAGTARRDTLRVDTGQAAFNRAGGPERFLYYFPSALNAMPGAAGDERERMPLISTPFACRLAAGAGLPRNAAP
jgi:hypothetical protein